jgi:CBS domain-containing protein
MPNRAVLKVIQNRDFLTSTPEKSVFAVAVHMKEYHADAVLIVDETSGKLQGICTERDLAFKLLAEGLDAKQTPVSQIMTGNLTTIGPDKPFDHALHMMFEGGFRHLPVVDPSGRPLGIISSRDALNLEIVDFIHEVDQRETLTEIL